MVRVHATPLNRADLAMLNGASHGSTGEMDSPPGLDWAGEIAALGESVTGWKHGDRISSSSGRAFADYTLGFATLILPVPAALSYAETATMPVALLTSHDGLATIVAPQPDQSGLIEGASSGVVLMALRVAKYLGAGLTIGLRLRLTSARNCASVTTTGCRVATAPDGSIRCRRQARTKASIW